MSLGFVLATVSSFLVMDIVAYVTHRWVMHGWLWSLHRSHHFPRKGAFEANDAFAVVFAALAIVFLALGVSDGFRSVLFGIGCGVTLYGAAYFFVHDVFTHRRAVRVESNSAWLNRVRKSHRLHHQSVEKGGQEPFGFLWYKL